MKNAILYVVRTFLSKELDFRVRLFNLLAIAGTTISLSMTIGSLIGGAGLLM